MNRLTRLTCHFADKGFDFPDGSACPPCGVTYHRGCVRAGWPFTCRRRDHRGLRFPKANYWPLFICECCTVRSVTGRELEPGPMDEALLRLERMRMLDLANSWAANTYTAYNGKLRFLASFESFHKGVSVLPHPVLVYPPRHASIPLAWAEESFTLRQGAGPAGGTVAYGTTRQLRSAAGWSHAVAVLVGQPGTHTMDDRQRNKLYRQDVGINHDATLSQFTKGLKGRVGTDAVPSWVLRDRHVRAFDRYFNANYNSSRHREDRRHWALAGLANGLLWLAWLRSSELFGLRWLDIECIYPSEGPAHDLPPNVGALLLRLGEETKTSRSRTADVPIAYTTQSGFQLGRWYERCRRLRVSSVQPSLDPRLLFQNGTATPWDSHFFRHEFVYPLLYQAQLDGDPVLVPLKGDTLGNTIPAKYKSLHMYRRGANSHVEIVRPHEHPRRKATSAEQYEHGRWTRQRSGEPLHVMYRDWPLWDRLQITLFCM